MIYQGCENFSEFGLKKREAIKIIRLAGWRDIEIRYFRTTIPHSGCISHLEKWRWRCAATNLQECNARNAAHTNVATNTSNFKTSSEQLFYNRRIRDSRRISDIELENANCQLEERKIFRVICASISHCVNREENKLKKGKQTFVTLSSVIKTFDFIWIRFIFYVTKIWKHPSS